MFVLCETVPR